MSGRDYQKSKVYAWEWDAFRSKDVSKIPHANAQGLIDYIWTQEGLVYPPRLEKLHQRVTSYAGKANRNNIWLPDHTTNSVLIHEIAHSMTCHSEGESDGHGKDYVGVFMKLLEKYMKIPMPLMMYTAQKHNVEFNLAAKPWCVD